MAYSTLVRFTDLDSTILCILELKKTQNGLNSGLKQLFKKYKPDSTGLFRLLPLSP